MPGTVQIQMPQMGESVTEGTVLEWHKQEGDFVNEGETVVEVSTDKIDAEVPAPASGVITRILKAPDETIEVGAILAELDPSAAPSGDGGSANGGDAQQEPGPGMSDQEVAEGDQDIGDESAGSESPQPGEATAASTSDEVAVQVSDPAGRSASQPADTGGGAEDVGRVIQISMPEMGESVTEGTVLEWHKQEGDAVSQGETVVEVSTDKVDAEVPAPASGTIARILAQPDETVQVGQVLAELTAGAGAPTDGAPPPAEPTSSAPAPAAGATDGTRASPVARRVAAASGVDLGAVRGSAPGGKVTKADVLAAANGEGLASAGPAAPDGGAVVPLRGPAAMLAQAMNESRSVPTATSFRTLAVDVLDAKRRALNGALKERAMKVSFTHLVAWAIVIAAIEWRVMGRSYAESDGKSQAIEPGGVNLGIAVDVERKDGSRSLMVPCIKGADQLDFAGFHAYYEELINKTRANRLSADDFQGTTITLTNPGGLGTSASVPRLMAGQGTIVATGSIAYPVEWAHAPAEKLKALGVSKVMTMTSTYDHRVIQGAESGSFLRRIDQLLQGEDSFYEGLAESLELTAGVVANAYPAAASAPASGGLSDTQAAPPDTELLQAVQAATSLLKAYRTHGHLAARLDPLGKEPKGDPAIDPKTLNLTPDLMAQIPASILRIGVAGETLLEALPRMREAYCETVAYQIEHLSSHQQRMWLREMIETGAHRTPLTDEEKKALLSRLIEVFQVRALPAARIPGPEDVLDRGPRCRRPDDRRAARPRPQGRRAGGGPRDGPPREARRPGSQPRPPGRVDHGRVRGCAGARAGQGDGGDPARGDRRRQVSPRRRGHVHDPRRRPDRGPALPEPEPPRVRGPGGHRWRARRADLARRGRASSTIPSSPFRCSCTATPPSRARAWWPRRSTCSR